MQCRNCEHYSDSEFRYCPRCGAPSSLGWPMAGAPWLRRPAAIAGLGILIVAWLFALQKALWLPDRVAERGRPSVSAPEQKLAQVPARPVVKERRVVRASAPQPVRRVTPAELPATGAARPPRIAARPAAKPVVVRQTPGQRQLALKTRRETVGRVAPAAGGSRPGPERAGRMVLAEVPPAVTPRYGTAMQRVPAPARPRARTGAAPRPQRARVGAWRSASDQRGTGLWNNPSSPERQQPRLVAARFERRPPPASVARSSRLVVQVSAQSAGQTTYVYYNGGSMLGIAPLRVRFDRPGRHRLTFWTPRLARWTERWVTVRGRGPQRFAVRMTPGRSVARVN